MAFGARSISQCKNLVAIHFPWQCRKGMREREFGSISKTKSNVNKFLIKLVRVHTMCSFTAIYSPIFPALAFFLHFIDVFDVFLPIQTSIDCVQLHSNLLLKFGTKYTHAHKLTYALSPNKIREIKSVVKYLR